MPLKLLIFYVIFPPPLPPFSYRYPTFLIINIPLFWCFKVFPFIHSIFDHFKPWGFNDFQLLSDDCVADKIMIAFNKSTTVTIIENVNLLLVPTNSPFIIYN